MEQKWPLRVIVTDGDIRRIALDAKPIDLESFTSELKTKLALPNDFQLQFEDPLFSNALCNVTDVSELPDRPTLKIVCCESLSSTTYSQASTISFSSDDTVSLMSSCDVPKLTRQEPWPVPFEIPNFSVDVDFRLQQGNQAYMENGTRIHVSRDMKHVILETLAETIYKYHAYPKEFHFCEVAFALITKHPCLREAGSPTRCSGWKNSLKFKMGNYRQKLSKSGIDAVVNTTAKRKRFVDEESSSNFRRPRRSETNFLPNFPPGENADILETVRRRLECEAKKRRPDSSDINKMMEQTFPLRRKEIVEEQPPVRQMLERWPVLFTESQVFEEFQRVASRTLKRDFFEALDNYSGRLTDIFKSKKGAVGQSLNKVLQQKNAQTQDITTTRAVVLRCLPVYLGDDYKTFFLRSTDSETTRDFSQVAVGILTVLTEDQTPISIILEGNVIMDDIPSYPLAMCLLFGLIYALHLDYPKGMKNTFEFIQKVLLNIGEQKLSPKLQSLKNALLV